ncbi:MAG: transposase [Pirellulales bacterium]|nr:transposase [Pirellulales bacterium]
MDEFIASLITWTTYGTWLPGDGRGWRTWGGDRQQPQPKLERWVKNRLKRDPVTLSAADRATVESAIREHCDFRNWTLLAVNARSNHVHVVVGARTRPQTVRDQLKANCTRRLRQQVEPPTADRIWTAGGDCEFLRDDAIAAAVDYVVHAQDKPR